MRYSIISKWEYLSCSIFSKNQPHLLMYSYIVNVPNSNGVSCDGHKEVNDACDHCVCVLIGWSIHHSCGMSLDKLIFFCVLWRDISFEIRNHWVMTWLNLLPCSMFLICCFLIIFSLVFLNNVHFFKTISLVPAILSQTFDDYFITSNIEEPNCDLMIERFFFQMQRLPIK